VLADKTHPGGGFGAVARHYLLYRNLP